MMLNLGGTYRAIEPQQTLAMVEPLLRPVFGITRVANITGLDHIHIPTYVAIRPQSKFFSTAQGKGITHDLAKISAMMESIEGWHAENMPSPDLFGSAQTLEKKYTLMHFEQTSHAFYQTHSSKIMTSEIPWVQGIELHTGQAIYVPMGFIHLDYTQTNNLDKPSLHLPSSTNGLASGNTLEEALCHALYEVIERHCWYQADHLPSRYIDPETLQSAHIQALLACLKHQSIGFEFMEMTDEIQVPTFLAKIYDTSGLHAVGGYIGAGTHLSSEVALSRAITEAIQSRLTFISGSREDAYPLVYRDIQHNALSLKRPSLPATLFPFYETPMPTNFNNCLDQILSLLKQAGHDQVIMYNHTRENIGIPVVHVLIPSLQFNIFHHTHIAYAPDAIRTLSHLDKEHERC